MKKLSACLLGLMLMVLLGCSSVPEGTNAIGDIEANLTQHLGQKVVVVGRADTGIRDMAAVGLFKVSQGDASLWASVTGGFTPPQGEKVRVTGVLQEKEFAGGVGKQVYIESQKVEME